MKKLIFLFILFGHFSQAQNTALFEKGHSAYNKGEFEIAVTSYETILESGETSAELYFNLANAYYKLDQLAPSIYFYEKALQLDPNDSDIKNNLSIAKNLVVDEIEEEQPSGVVGIWNNLVSVLSFNQWGWAAIIFSFGFAILFALYYFSTKSLWKRIFFSTAMFSAFLALLFLIFAFQQKGVSSENNYAIIFAQETPVRDEPTLRSKESFYLHEGTKIEVLEKYQNWIKIELANGIQGWLSKDDIRLL